MGAENSSHMKSVTISEKQLIEKLKNDILMFDGKLNHTNQKISIFEDVGDNKENPFKDYSLERPLARAIRNLKIYRHPYSIIKFLASTNDKTLITELLIGSLDKYLKNQNEIQICLGLKNILNALIFLVEAANVRHLNVSTESIFVTDNLTWKLGGAEHLFKNSEISIEFLKKSRQSKRCRDPEYIDPSESDGTGLEQYAFATLCETVIKKDSKIPFAQDFLSYCQSHLKHKNPTMRPLLSAVQLHNFFCHDFITIHSFLSELALKTQPAKQEFFKTLNDKLKQFDENIIGSQLSDLLLSRLVLLEPSAQYYLLPFLLKPQNLEEDEENSSDDYLFTTAGFIKYIVPKLKQVFCVLDVQIRLILLENFHLYVNVFTKEELVDEILPQLLLGIKDINDLLVTKTLLCLAELIPILGASLVIGKNRRKLFADGRPQQNVEMWTNENLPRSITPINSSIDILSSSPVDHVDISEHSDRGSSKLILSNGFISKSDIVDDEHINDKTIVPNEVTPVNNNDIDDDDVTDNEIEWNWDQDGKEDEQETIIEEKIETPTKIIIEKPATTVRPKIVDNIDDLDIKNKKLTKQQEQAEDFFSDFDMTPTFKTSNVHVVEASQAKQQVEEKSDKTDLNSNNSSRLQMSSVIETVEGGWGDDDNWNDESDL
ncbi:protein-associating with the carboxyl-terminal domain of ezrin [Chironomus tepperi]|uniref:protein-associating with the carboxyl-terminal domain of ezrin n=1 Tax=Chironomus tepperi TaxID=113505 RepID=UPI00391F2D61